MPFAPSQEPLGHVEAALEQHLRVFLRGMIPRCLDAAAVRCAGGAITTDVLSGDVHHALTLALPTLPTTGKPHQTLVMRAPGNVAKDDPIMAPIKGAVKTILAAVVDVSELSKKKIRGLLVSDHGFKAEFVEEKKADINEVIAKALEAL